MFELKLDILPPIFFNKSDLKKGPFLIFNCRVKCSNFKLLYENRKNRITRFYYSTVLIFIKKKI